MLDDAITAMFNIKYHPWVQDGTVRGCIEEGFDDSLSNQKILFGRYMRSVFQSIIGLSVFLVGMLI